MLASGKLPPDALPGDLAGQVNIIIILWFFQYDIITVKCILIPPFLQDCVLGLEFSGRNTQGQRVMGMVAARSLATTVLADPGFLWEVPSNWTLEEASSVPVVYGTVNTNLCKSVDSLYFGII